VHGGLAVCPHPDRVFVDGYSEGVLVDDSGIHEVLEQAHCLDEFGIVPFDLSLVGFFGDSLFNHVGEQGEYVAVEPAVLEADGQRKFVRIGFLEFGHRVLKARKVGGKLGDAGFGEIGRIVVDEHGRRGAQGGDRGDLAAGAYFGVGNEGGNELVESSLGGLGQVKQEGCVL